MTHPERLREILLSLVSELEESIAPKAYDKAIAAIQDAELELVGEDEVVDPIGDGLQANLEYFAHNELRRELRNKIKGESE